jgi:uncharacterized protein (DUF927 family)
LRDGEDGNEGFFRETAKGIFTSDGIFLCPPLKVTAWTRTKDSDGWGLLLEWKDADGIDHHLSMPLEWLGGDGKDLRENLLRGGLRINPHPKRHLILSYLHSQMPKQRVIIASHIGWHDRRYVLPDTSIPEGADRVLYQNPGEHRFYVRGTLKDWRETIGSLCAGNSRLVFSVGCAFAAPLLRPLELEGGGCHLVGPSSVGKTTTLYVAGSVCGAGSHGQSFKRSWRATQNGIEATAEGHNDNLLLLDEMREMGDPRELDSMVYMLANGAGKSRATKENAARRSLTWLLFLLSTGEVKLSEYAGAAGSKIKAGAQVRLVNIPADAGKGMGLFETLHGTASPREFSEQLQKASNQQYGTALRAFLQNFVRDYDGNVAWIKKQMNEFQNRALPPEARPGAAPEVGRALTRFALVAAAGELATKFGITGWKCDESRRAALRCFRDWIRDRGGTGQSDIEEGLSRVRHFFQLHGASRFQSVITRIDPVTGESINEEKIQNRAGYWKNENGERWYFIFPEVWEREICQGYDPRQIAKALAKDGLLKKGDGDNLTRKETIPGGRPRFYVIKANLDINREPSQT